MERHRLEHTYQEAYAELEALQEEPRVEDRLDRLNALLAHVSTQPLGEKLLLDLWRDGLAACCEACLTTVSHGQPNALEGQVTLAAFLINLLPDLPSSDRDIRGLCLDTANLLSANSSRTTDASPASDSDSDADHEPRNPAPSSSEEQALVAALTCHTLYFVRGLISHYQDVANDPLPFESSQALVYELMFRIVQSLPSLSSQESSISAADIDVLRTLAALALHDQRVQLELRIQAWYRGYRSRRTWRRATAGVTALQRIWRARRTCQQHRSAQQKQASMAMHVEAASYRKLWATEREQRAQRIRREAAGAQRFAQGAREQLKRAIETLRVSDAARPELQNQLDAWREQHLVDVTSLSDAELLLRLRQQQDAFRGFLVNTRAAARATHKRHALVQRVKVLRQALNHASAGLEETKQTPLRDLVHQPSALAEARHRHLEQMQRIVDPWWARLRSDTARDQDRLQRILANVPGRSMSQPVPHSMS
ncbi:uncharacterized protein MONBRDRAFT_10125 [Monosiga brevicollis MX1]|uniref:Uncharacterized protein n=1 Tax=Monosiga brevicollis TaxID=81824 RepID=A9V5A5_MONBE|nr:uncharacterized protein MONBRDRAFT_10125 [Monosiga brevicollis MX1]EDQ87342.1 predicted protein [Monosiga brevicollis MX1]|eukprot:XP_001747955.1 hypothetical protein [Monosiga brevicollis MX1]